MDISGDFHGGARWRREHTAQHHTGALDLPGTSWRNHPAVARGNHIYLAADMAAAPGLVAEVSINSALLASDLAVGTCVRCDDRGESEAAVS